MIASDVENEYEEEMPFRLELYISSISRSDTADYWYGRFIREGVHYPMLMGNSIFRIDVMRGLNYLTNCLGRLSELFKIETWLTLMDCIRKIAPVEKNVIVIKEKTIKINMNIDSG